MYSKTSLLTGTLYVARDITADIIILVAEPSCSQVHHFVVVVVGPLPPPKRHKKTFNVRPSLPAQRTYSQAPCRTTNTYTKDVLLFSLY